MGEAIEKLAAHFRDYPFELPGAGGLRGELHISMAASRELAMITLDALSEPTEGMRFAAHKASREGSPYFAEMWRSAIRSHKEMTEIQRLARVLAIAVIGDATHVDKVDDFALRHYAEGVRALLREIREPTEVMVNIAHSRSNTSRGSAAAIWRTMIDELLK